MLRSYPALDPALRPRRPQRDRRRAVPTRSPATDVVERLGIDLAPAVGRVRRPDHPPEGRPHLLRAALQFDERAQVVLLAGAADTPELAAETEAAVGRAA